MSKSTFRFVWWQQILFISLASVIYMQVMGLVGTRVVAPAIGWGEGLGAIGESANPDRITSRFVRWDAGFYLQIARYGYRPTGDEIAFFPLYAILIRGLNTVLGQPLFAAGWMISILCLVGACFAMYLWVLIDYGHEIALWAVLWLCCFPMAFFLTATYPEALFLALSITSAYFARRGQFIASGLAIAFAGAARPFGIFLAIPFVLEFWQQRNFSPRDIAGVAIGALLAPLGAAAFFAHLGQITNNANFFAVYFANQSAGWKRSFAMPWITLYDGINAALFGTRIRTDWFSRAVAIQDLTYAVLGLVGAIYSLRVLRPSAAWFLVVSMIYIYTNHGETGYAFWSVPRHVLALFPIYLLLALVTLKLNPVLRWVLVAGSLGMQGVLAAWFASAHWVA